MKKKSINMFKNIFCFGILFLFINFISEKTFAQKSKTKVLTTDEAKIVKKDGATMFNGGNYSGALKAYIDLVKSDDKNPDYNYKLGMCYLLAKSIKTKAIPYLEFASKQKNPPKDIQYYLGMAYMNALRWDDAEESLSQYKKAGKKTPDKDQLDVDRLLEMCSDGRDLTEHSLKLTFENPGKIINSPFPDYNPIISADGTKLIFTSKRKGNMGGFIEDIGEYTADVFISTFKDSVWSKARSVGTLINTAWDEECIGLTANGNSMLLFLDNEMASGDIAECKTKGKSYVAPVVLPVAISAANSQETGATISADGTMLIFASDRKDKTALGKKDLYMCRRESNASSWGKPVNLGSDVNSKFDEDAPFLFADGKTLFFSSKGHNSMGGYDVFKTVYDEGTESWGDPENIGYPANTPDDNLFFSICADGKTAYMALAREDGLGDQDIYKVTFNDSALVHPLTIIRANVASSTGGKLNGPTITVTDMGTDKEFGKFSPEGNDNNILIMLPSGKYKIKITALNDFKEYEETIETTDKSEKVLDKKFLLEPKGKK